MGEEQNNGNRETLAVAGASAGYRLPSRETSGIRPGYKLTEVGVIPEDWEVRSLGDLNPFVTSGSRGWAAFYSDRGSLFVRITNMSRDSIYLDLENPKFVNLPAESSEGIRTQLQEHDVLVSITADIGIVSYVDPQVPIPAYINQHIALVRFNQSKTCGKFVSYFLASEKPQRLFRASTDTGAKAGMSLPTVQKIEVALPPLPEQRAIAVALGDVDALLGGLERLIAKQRDLKQAAMQQLLTGQTRLPGFSGEWEVKGLGEVTTLIPSGVYGEEMPRDSLIPFRVATTAHIEMNDTWNDKEMNTRYFTREQVERHSPMKGDLLVVKSSGSAASIQSGKIGFVDERKVGEFLFSNFLMLLRPVKISPIFLYFHLCSQRVKKLLPTLVEASTYPNIRIPEYLALGVPVPPDPEQTAIAAVLSDMDAELSALEARRDKTRNLKQGMMQELLTGRTRLVES